MRVSTILRMPTIGPLVLGLIAGGVPCAAVFIYTGVDWQNAVYFLILFTPVSIGISAASAMLGPQGRHSPRFGRALLTGFAASVPGPALIVALDYGFIERQSGARDLVGFLFFFAGWAITVVALPAWLIARAYVRYDTPG